MLKCVKKNQNWRKMFGFSIGNQEAKPLPVVKPYDSYFNYESFKLPIQKAYVEWKSFPMASTSSWICIDLHYYQNSERISCGKSLHTTSNCEPNVWGQHPWQKN